MAIQPPPVITPVPTPAIQRGDRVTFSSRVDAFVIWLVSAVSQFGAVATNVYNNAVDAASSATSALSNKGLSQAAADAAESYRTQAKNSADAAAASAGTIGTTAAFSDANPIAKNAANNTKTARLDLSLISPSTQRVYQLPDKSGKVALIGDGGLAFLGEITLAAPAAAIDFLTIFNNPSHDRFLITLHYVKAATNFVPPALRWAVGGVVESGAGSYGISNMTGGSISGSSSHLTLGPTGTNNAKDYEITLHNKNRALSESGCTWLHVYGTGSQMFAGSFNAASTNPISGFRILITDNTNIAAGAVVRVYGYAKS